MGHVRNFIYSTFKINFKYNMFKNNFSSSLVALFGKNKWIKFFIFSHFIQSYIVYVFLSYQVSSEELKLKLFVNFVIPILK